MTEAVEKKESASEKISAFISKLEFKKKRVGGVDEQEVFIKFAELDVLYKAAFAEKLGAVKEGLQKKQEIVDRQEKEIRELKEKIEKLSVDHPDFDSVKEEHQKEVAAIKAQLTGANEAAEIAEAHAQQAEKALGETQSRLNDAERRLSDIEKSLADTQQRLADTQQRLADTEKSLLDANSRLAEAQNNAGMQPEATAIREELKREINGLNDRLEAAIFRAQKAELLLEEAQKQAAQNDGAALAAEHKREIDRLNEQLSIAIARTQQTERQLDESDRRLSDSEKRLSETEKPAQLIMEQNAWLKQENARLESEKAELATRLSETKAALEEEKTAKAGATPGYSSEMAEELLALKARFLDEALAEKDVILAKAHKDADEIVKQAMLQKEQLKLASHFEISQIHKEKQALALELNRIAEQIGDFLGGSKTEE